MEERNLFAHAFSPQPRSGSSPGSPAACPPATKGLLALREAQGSLGNLRRSQPNTTPSTCPPPGSTLDLGREIQRSEEARACVEWISFTVPFQTSTDINYEKLRACLVKIATELHYPPDVRREGTYRIITPLIRLDFDGAPLGEHASSSSDVVFTAGKHYNLAVSPGGNTYDFRPAPKEVLEAFKVVVKAFDTVLEFEQLVDVIVRRRPTYTEEFHQLPLHYVREC